MPAESTTEVAGLDDFGRDPRTRQMANADLAGAELAGCDLRDANLTGANLRGADLSNANLSGARLLHADLTGADLTAVEAVGVGFGGAVLDEAILFGADLTNASLSHASLRGCDLRTTSLEGARLIGVDLEGADLGRADLRGADLTDARLTKASLHDAMLAGTRLRGVRGSSSADWIGTSFTDADFTGAYLVRRDAIDQNYLHEFRSKSRHHELLYQLWRITSDCGRSFVRWGIWTGAFALSFAAVYPFVAIDYGPHETALSPLYLSYVTLTTLGFGDVVPASMTAQIVVMFEVVLGYVMLGGLMSIFATKMGRRGE